MAIDDAEKRKSASGIQATLIAGVTPNSSKDQEWRQQSGWGYSGIVTAAISVGENVVSFIFRPQGRRSIFKGAGKTRIFQSTARRKIFKQI